MVQLEGTDPLDRSRPFGGRPERRIGAPFRRPWRTVEVLNILPALGLLDPYEREEKEKKNQYAGKK